MPRKSIPPVTLILRLLLVVAVFVLGVISLGNYLLQPADVKNKQRFEFEISPGEGLDQISARLYKSGLIRSKEAFKIYLLSSGISKKIQAGFFYLSPSQSVSNIANSLTKAQSRQIWVTILEGLRREEIANLILDTLEKEDFPHQFNPEQFIKLTTNLEGHLYPDTYAFPQEVDTQFVISKLTNRFNQIIKKLNISPQKLNQTIILASLLEREAAHDSERAEIAGILTNRLNNDWPLQIDATVQFSLASSNCRLRICNWWPKSLTKDDLALDSAYNTYKYPGLPKGPISNPGKASLEAAANPKQTNNWFYLHDSKGQIHYAKTAQEHNKNICTYLNKNC